jgi:hypothetical protein
LSVQVAGRYIACYPEDGQKHALRAVEKVVAIAKSSAGRRVAREFGVNFAVAIPFRAIESENFTMRRWPQIVEELATAANLRESERKDLSRFKRDGAKSHQEQQVHEQRPGVPSQDSKHDPVKFSPYAIAMGEVARQQGVSEDQAIAFTKTAQALVDAAHRVGMDIAPPDLKVFTRHTCHPAQKRPCAGNRHTAVPCTKAKTVTDCQAVTATAPRIALTSSCSDGL